MPNVGLTPGSGVNVAVNQLTRDGVTEVIQLLNPTDDRGYLLVPTAVRPVAANAAAGPINNGAGATGPGRLHYITVTASGGAAMTLTDGAGGAVLFTLPANAPVGEYPLISRPFNTSLYANTGTGSPAFSAGVS